MRPKIWIRTIISFVTLALISKQGFAQQSFTPPLVGALTSTIAPDARSAALAEMGLATSADDPFSLYHNISKLPFSSQKWGVGIGYTPWLSSLARDMGITSLSGFYAMNDRYKMGHAFSAALTYFDIGEVLVMPKKSGEIPYEIAPYELNVAVGYALRFSDHWSIGGAFHFVRSDFNVEISKVRHAANSFLVDLSTTYRNSFKIAQIPVQLQAAVALHNIGNSISYDGGLTRLFAPTTFKMGAGVTHFVEMQHRLSYFLEIEKMLAPLMPSLQDKTNYQVEMKEINAMSALKALGHSFHDNPKGLMGELEEMSAAVGVEYLYDQFFFARAGARLQSAIMGNTGGAYLGLGIHYSYFTFDMSYFEGVRTDNPLNGTFRLSITATL